MTDWLIAIVLGLVEGATEFVPVSSTGHLIVFGHAFGYTGEKAATFEVVIQLGAILAVAWLYRRHLLALASIEHRPGFAGRRGWVLLGLTTAPALFLGALFHDAITGNLFNPTTVALGWGIGGVAMILVERWRPRTTVTDLHTLNWRTASLIGVAQCCALWPGFSRAGATMTGAMALGVRRETAAEYSFLAAIPVIAAATVLRSGHQPPRPRRPGHPHLRPRSGRRLRRRLDRRPHLPPPDRQHDPGPLRLVPHRRRPPRPAGDRAGDAGQLSEWAPPPGVHSPSPPHRSRASSSTSTAPWPTHLREAPSLLDRPISALRHSLAKSSSVRP